jgi:DNA-binding XRE family transcriptional regulator
MNTPKSERTQRPDESERAIESGSHAARERSADPELEKRTQEKRAVSASADKRSEPTAMRDAEHRAEHAATRPEKVERAASGHPADPAAPDDTRGSESGARPSSAKKVRGKNNVRKLRMERMMSKAELARRAGLSTLTIDRVEKGMACRMDTKRKILEALGLTPSDRVRVFGDDD